MKNFNQIATETVPENLRESQAIMKSAAREITRSSTALTQSKPLPKKLNAAEELGKIFDRFRRQTDWRLEGEETVEAKKDRGQFIAAALEVLGAARVPVESYERLYRRAMVSRARRRAEGKSVNFKLSGEDLATEWFVLQKEIAEAPPAPVAEMPEDECPNRHQHIGSEAIVEYLFAGKKEVVLPCHACRPKAFTLRNAEFVENHNNSFANRRLGTGESGKRSEPKKADAANREKTLSEKIIGQAMADVGKELRRTQNRPEYQNHYNTWLKLVRVGEYVKTRENENNVSEK